MEKSAGGEDFRNQSVTVDLDADSTIGYASIQNSIPVVRSLRIANRSESALEDLIVSLECSPAFCKGARFRFERLAPGEVRTLSPIDLVPDHAFLSSLQEGSAATIVARVMSDALELAHSNHALYLLSYDQWAGLRSLPELLAAFCMPNNPTVDLILGKASKLLRDSFPEISLDGYQSKSRDVVWKQISAIYSTLASEDLQYAEPPASFETDGQKVRTPDRIFESRVATCLDLTLLFASCFEQAGLRPVILLKEGHAWIGVWMVPASFGSPLVDDAQAIMKRVESGELIVFETTAIARHRELRPSLRISMESGFAHISQFDAFRFAIDIHRAREARIRPLPSKSTARERDWEVFRESAPLAIEPTPHLPPLDPALFQAVDVTDAGTPEGRLSKWKTRLLDLTLRNRLLNFKATKTTLQLIAPDVGRLEDALSDGSEFRIRPLPVLMEGNDPRVAQIHVGRTGRMPLDEMSLEALKGKELLTRVAKPELDVQLLALNAAARTGLEEGGANTLYLAIGFLKWMETEKSESAQSAPILLLPVTLERQSVQGGFRLKRHDDDAIVNPTLLQFLKAKFELKIIGLEETPPDDHGLDVQKILQAFRIAVRDLKGWQVEEHAFLGIFSFTKYLMWKDLQDRADQLKANRVVKHLIDHPGEAFARENSFERTQGLDETHRPHDLLAPLLADSSQLMALCAVDEGSDLVLEGPPGTGKSQTITNLIAHSLAKGKTVLFVSEKMAALEVVHRRLNAIGLGPFCLELHSSRAKKSEVLEQLGHSLNASGQRTAEQWTQEAERVARLRANLNDLVIALHTRHANGLTAHDAIGTCIANAGNDPTRLSWTDPYAHDLNSLEALREVSKKMAILAKAIGTLVAHPLRTVGQTEWTPSWQESLLDACIAVQSAFEDFQKKAAAVEPILGRTTSGLSLDDYDALDKVIDHLIAASSIPAGLARKAHDTEALARIKSAAKHGKSRSSSWQLLSSDWNAQLGKVDADELRQEWARACASWWPKSTFSKRSIRHRLLSFRSGGRKPTEVEIENIFDPLSNVNAEDHFLASMESELQCLLGEAFKGTETDWDGVLEHVKTARAFSETLIASVGGDPAIAKSMKETIESFVAERRTQLDPLKAVGRALADYRNSWRIALRDFQILEGIAKPLEPLQGTSDAAGALERILDLTLTWNASRNSLQAWCLWRRTRQQAIELGLAPLVSTLESGRIEIARAEAHFEFSYRNWWVKKIIDREPLLRTFSSADQERKILEFREADEIFQKLTEQYIAAILSGKIPSSSAVTPGSDSEMGKLRRELQKQRRHLPVRQLVQGLPTLLPKLKPCLLMSPLSVAQYLDASFPPFDLVVFDEASQIAVWDAVGAIARGKQLVVVGDPKQLPPTNFFGRSRDSESGSTNDDDVEDLESILDECLGAGMRRLSLKWHYRSKHESLITFSNVNYYESKLITFPSPVTTDRAVTFRKINGVYDRGGSKTNRAEADAIVGAIEAHFLSKRQSHLSLGVVTFNQPQQALIEELLEARRRGNDRLDGAIMARSSEPVFVKNLENVQGDERDVIFFSITYGPDAAGKTLMNFGPLNLEGGHRRLNVAISRARERVEIFSTLVPQAIDLSRVRAAGVRDLKNYLDFAIKGPRALVEQSSPTGREPDSPFETAVIWMLSEKGWTVHPQVGCSGYRIDLAVVDPAAPGRYLLGIECDGRSYHSGATARDRDRLRQLVLEGLGWKIHRIWSTDWWVNSAGEIEKIDALLSALVNANQEAEELEREDAADGTALPEAEGSGELDSLTEKDVQVDATGNLKPLPPLGSETHRVVPKAEQMSPSLPVYRSAEIEACKPLEFYETHSNRLLLQQIQQVVQIEGPVSETVLFRKIARAWGLERTGGKIVDRLRRLAPQAVHRTFNAEASFYWPLGIDLNTWDSFRVSNSDDSSRRSIHDVAHEEIAALIRHVLRNSGSISKAEIARAVCRLVGMARTPADAEARVLLTVERMRTEGKVEEKEGYIREAV